MSLRCETARASYLLTCAKERSDHRAERGHADRYSRLQWWPPLHDPSGNSAVLFDDLVKEMRIGNSLENRLAATPSVGLLLRLDERDEGPNLI